MWVGTGDTKLFLRALHLEEPNYQERKAELCKEGIQQEAGELEWSTGCGAGALFPAASKAHSLSVSPASPEPTAVVSIQ